MKFALIKREIILFIQIKSRRILLSLIELGQVEGDLTFQVDQLFLDFVSFLIIRIVKYPERSAVESNVQP
jgi:hypothetical protein